MVNYNVSHKDIKLINSLKNKEKIKVLFVCLGNICRSPAAEAMFRDIVGRHGTGADFAIDSAGTAGYHCGEQPDRRMRVHARRRGLELNHECRKFDIEDFYNFDLIIGMDTSNLRDLRALAPSVEAARKIHGMAEFFPAGSAYDHVPDPYYEGAEGFELVLDLLEGACENLYNTISERI